MNSIEQMILCLVGIIISYETLYAYKLYTNLFKYLSSHSITQSEGFRVVVETPHYPPTTFFLRFYTFLFCVLSFSECLVMFYTLFYLNLDNDKRKYF